MCDQTLLPDALRQFRHNNSDEFVAAYDIETVDAVIERLTADLKQAKGGAEVAPLIGHIDMELFPPIRWAGNIRAELRPFDGQPIYAGLTAASVDERSEFEKVFDLESGAYWCDSNQCYMRDAGGGFTVSVNPLNDRWAGWQARARLRAQQQGGDHG